VSLRILHFSDVHLPLPPGAWRSPEALHPKRIAARLNFILRRGNKYTESLQKLNGLNEFLRREPVDYLLYTGDTLNFGLVREFMDAAPRVAETLTLARQGALAVPGNHDLYTGASPAHYERHFGPHSASDLPEAATSTGYPIVRWMGPEAAAIAINSSRPNFNFWNSSGHVPAAELEALGQLLARPEIANRRHVFLLTHYPFDEAGFFHGLRNARALLKTLQGHKNLILLHGHNHRAYTYFLPNSPVPLYCAGSLSKRDAESFWLFDLFGGVLNPRRGVWRNARFTLVE
jgi:3',5'-cyclic AMP phosphodiesterase CpdA